MDKATIIGLPMAFASIVACLILEGGAIANILGGPAFMIVICGSLGAVMVNVPFKECMTGLMEAKKAVLGNKINYEAVVQEIVRLAGIARKDGLLALEKERDNIEDPLLREAIKFAVDGLDPAMVSQILEARIDHKIHQNGIYAKVWKQWGAYAPTVAIVGAVLGLIIVMQNLDNPELIGPGIAVAFIATVYGVTFSNVVFLPIGGKLEILYQKEALYYEMVRLGVKDIQLGTSPSIISSRLLALLDQEGLEEDAA